MSLIDVVVSLTMLAMVVLLLMPALLQATADARKQQCSDRLRTLGKAFLSFENARGGFPPRRTGLGGDQPYGGWGSQLLPQLAESLAAKYRYDYDYFDPINQAVVETRLPMFVCPEAPPDRVLLIKSNASGNSANPDKDTLFEVNCAPNDFISSNGLSMPRNGYGLNWPSDVSGVQHQAMTDRENLPLSKITDGLSNTILLIEKAGAPKQCRLGKCSQDDDLFAGQNISRGTWAGFGSIQFRSVDPSDGNGPPRGDNNDCTVNCNNTFGIYAFHKAGANILLCDGAVRFVGERLDGLTHGRLTTRDDGQLISNDAW